MKRVRWTKRKIINISKKYDSLKSFYDNEIRAYTAAYSRGILDEVTNHMTRKRVKKNYYSDSKLLEIMDQYSCLKSFREGDQNAYAAAIRRGLVDMKYHRQTYKFKLKALRR